MSDTCDVCGLESVEGQTFVTEELPLLRRRKYCPDCHARFDHRVQMFFLLLVALGGVAGVILLALNPDSGAGRAGLNFLLFHAFLLLAVFPHEFGHAFVARWLGVGVGRVVIGAGRVVWSGRLFRFNLILRWLPYMGYTQILPSGTSWPRAREFLVILAGPLTNVVLALAMIPFLREEDLWNFEPTSPLSLPWLFCVANILTTVESLVPWAFNSPYGRLESDGLLMVRLLAGGRELGKTNGRSNPPSRFLVWFRRFLKWCCVVFLIVCAVMLFGIGVLILIGRNGGGKLDSALWPLATMFGGLGAAMLWLTWRLVRTSVDVPERSKRRETTRDPGVEYQEEIASRSCWREREEVRDGLRRMKELIQEGRCEEARKLLVGLQEMTPDDLLLLEWKAWFEVMAGDLEEAEMTCRRIAGHEGLSPESAAVALMKGWHIAVRRGAFQKVRQEVEDWMAGSPSLEARLRILDTLACIPFMEGRSDYLPEARHWIDEALVLQPQSLTLKGTLGAILFESGEADEAERWLTEVQNKSHSEVDQGISSLFLALCAKRRGQSERAIRLAKQATILHPEEWLIKRVLAEFPELEPWMKAAERPCETGG